jgi:hypothetical protein
MDAEIENLEKKLKAKLLKQGMMQQLLTKNKINNKLQTS